MITEIPTYPVLFMVDYPDRELDRLTTFLRPIVAIPILVILGAVSGTALRSGQASGTTEVLGSGGLLFLPTLLMILFRQKYPRWWFEWLCRLSRPPLSYRSRSYDCQVAPLGQGGPLSTAACCPIGDG